MTVCARVCVRARSNLPCFPPFRPSISRWRIELGATRQSSLLASRCVTPWLGVSVAHVHVRAPTCSFQDPWGSPDQNDGWNGGAFGEDLWKRPAGSNTQHPRIRPSCLSALLALASSSGGLDTHCAVPVSMTSERLSSLALGRLKLETFTGFSERTELHLCDRLALCKKKKKNQDTIDLSAQWDSFFFFCLCEKATVTKSQRQSKKSRHSFRFSGRSLRAIRWGKKRIYLCSITKIFAFFPRQ